MEKIEHSGLEIVRLYLSKLEQMTDMERSVLIKTIDILNHPLFVAPPTK